MTTPPDFTEHQSHVIKHALIITVLPLSPIPFLDWILEPILVRRMFEPLFKYPTQRRHFIGKGDRFCLGCLTGLLLYPIKKFVRIVKFFVQFNTFIKTFFYWFCKSYILYQAQNTISDACLTDNNKMILLSRDLDNWLRTSKELPSLTNTNITSLVAMQTLFAEVSNGNFETINSALQNTDILDSWLKSWAAEHDTPQ
jgi:hypothetical protein